jgi:hypothetical protein
MWLAPAIVVVMLVGYPLLIAPTKAVLVIGLLAAVLCVFGIVVRSTAVVVGGGVLALSQYTLALWLSAGPPRLAGAVLVGVGMMLLLETADFSRRVRSAALGPGLVASQVRYWAAFSARAGAVALVAAGLATAASAVVSLPWSPAVAAAGAAAALVAVVVALRRRHG